MSVFLQFILMMIVCLFGFIVLGKMVVVLVFVVCCLIEIVSVDLVFVYCDMDIGIVKLLCDECVSVLYYLIDIIDLVDVYLVVEFCVDMLWLIGEIVVCGCMLLFVGGMMLYYKVFMYGFNDLLGVDLEICVVFDVDVVCDGWFVLYVWFVQVDFDMVVWFVLNDLQ